MQAWPLPAEAFRLPGGRRTMIPLACLGLLSTACTIVLSLFPAEDDAHPTATFLKVVIMTVVLLGVGIAIYRSSGRRLAQDPIERNSA